MVWASPTEAMPWVGLYAGVASFVCTIAMAADAVQAIWQWKLWFPNRFFTLNAYTITLIAVAMKIPMDLTTNICEGDKNFDCDTNDSQLYRPQKTKWSGIYFLVTMLANFLPSLGLMDDKELLTNIVALGILLITIAVNIGIQLFSLVLLSLIPDLIPIFVFAILWPFSVALTVSVSRKKLEHRYKESQQLVLSHQEKRFSSKGLKQYVKNFWMMTETHNPQFVIACSPVSSAFGVICLYLGLPSGVVLVTSMLDKWYSSSDYKWSLEIIFIVQSIGVVVGSIAPIFRCFTTIGHYSLSKEWSKNYLNVFRVEKVWIQRLQQWKRSYAHSYIPGRQCKIVFHNVKKMFLNFCLALHIAVLVICKTICLVPRTFLILLSYCWYFFKLFLERFKKESNAFNSNVNSEIEEYNMYVVQIEDDVKLSKRILRNTLRYITQLLNKSEEKEPNNLILLLEKSSTGFNGVLEFDNDQVQSLYQEETNNCWSLVIVTLTAIAIALPNIARSHFKGLVAGVREGLLIVRHVEECLNTDGDIVKARKAATRLWTEVEIYRSWMHINLQKKARKRSTSKDILKWLGAEAEKVMKQFKSNKKPSIDQSPYKFILASSMYRISQTILLHCEEEEEEEENGSNDEELFEWVSTIIADVFLACFTNLPCVIKMKCHHHAIEKRGENIRNAAQLLGKSKKILKVLKARQLPNMDPDSMAYIAKWRVLPKSQLSNGSATSSLGIQPGSPGSNESIRVSVI